MNVEFAPNQILIQQNREILVNQKKIFDETQRLEKN